MSILLNPVTVAVIVLCALCLSKLNVIISMLIACLVGGVVGGLPVTGSDGSIMSLLTSGFVANAQTALAYVLLGTFATAIATTGLADILCKKLSKIIGGRRLVLMGILTVVAVLSQNVIPVHIAYIPILVPPLLSIMNEMKVDRRGVACCIAFGHKAPYIAIPFGFGLIFQDIVATNLSTNGMEASIRDVASINWVLALAMIVGLLVAVFISYRKPREYKMIKADTSASDAVSEKLEYRHYVTFGAILTVVVVQVISSNLALSALAGVMVMIIFGAIRLTQLDEQVAGGIKTMGLVSIVMLIAGGFAEVIKATGGVEALVQSAVGVMGGSKLIAAVVITLIGMLITMGIGTSFGTVPILAVLYVPLCQEMGFSLPATILLITAAATLGDAGSPASDTTLGPTSGLNADGQHDHIWDTCVPGFLHFSIPLMLTGIIASQFV